MCAVVGGGELGSCFQLVLCKTCLYVLVHFYAVKGYRQGNWPIIRHHKVTGFSLKFFFAKALDAPFATRIIIQHTVKL